MNISRRELMQIYRRLYRHFGDLEWWPGDTPLEISVGAILTQNTAWTNVEKAIRQLKHARAERRRAGADVPPPTRPADQILRVLQRKGAPA
jgi:endonuclease-3 related protein